jgi:PAS domain S-box-containing protein
VPTRQRALRQTAQKPAPAARKPDGRSPSKLRHSAATGAEPAVPPDTQANQALRAAILKTFFLAAAAAALIACLSQWLRPPPLPFGARALLLAAYAALGAGSLAATRLNGRQGQRAMLAVALGSVAVVGSSALLNGTGISAPGMVYLVLMVCLATVVADRSQGLLAAVAALAAVGLLAAAEMAGIVPDWRSRGMPPLLGRFVVLAAAFAIAGGAGHLVRRLVRAHGHAADERERRFQGLLGIAASAYWETDDTLRLMHVSQRDGGGRFVPLTALPRRPPWEQPELKFDEDLLDLLRADMESREAFRDVALHWQPPGADRPNHLLVSGDPRFDADGRFLGFWGVARDVTAERRAREALLATEQRYEALLSQVVSMSPDVITLTDLGTGRYEMVNASFCRLTGYEAAEVVGRSALEIGIWRSVEDRQRLTQALANNDAVQDVPIDFVARDGRVVPLLVSAARFARDGRAFLVINARDITESSRTRLEREAILDNASVGIAFTRERNFVMVNPHFEQMYGWPPGALVGQPGRVVWPSDAAYGELGSAVGQQLRKGEQVEFERTAMRRDGSTFIVRMRAKAIDPNAPGENGTIWIAEDVTLQRQAEGALSRARDEAEAANRAKSAFLANTSHEIRTPLNGLVGLARLARMPDVDPGRLHHYLEQIGASAETLSAIISDILDLSKIEAGKLEVETAPFDLPELLHTLQQAYEALADSRGLNFEVDIDPRLPPIVRGDALRVRQILANFLHNALKFTARGTLRLVVRRLLPDDGDTTPTVYRSGRPPALAMSGHAGTLAAGATGHRLDLHGLEDWIRFEVHDSGVGIDTETQARLFKPFTQADESITRRFGGTGLGLSICRELAELMGGQVGVSSTPGRGSCFHAELPLPVVDALEASSAHGALEHDPLRGARVLVVEDNAVNMMIGVAMLEQWGVDVTQADDGPQALAAVERAARAGQLFDAVLMDVQMPGMSGYEATRLLRKRWSLLQLPIVALTAAALTSERERATEIGMNDFLTKPIDANRLRMALQRVLMAGEYASNRA